MRRTSVIYVELAGGPTQFETYDPKPDAPIEYRGSFGIARTNVPGVIFSELMPEQAKLVTTREGLRVSTGNARDGPQVRAPGASARTPGCQRADHG